ncbi:glycosyltransferase family 25 protein [Helicobacter burdigaliensis]|uniref:glycosyltransferase family 25 protein n=1 Tax=Helicobacter burdigaliensis TaxID=2315334 RepID=UPI000EF63EC9|nr:glycosyltransferase family 25 protein [Helicobacter burdigaliensis]
MKFFIINLEIAKDRREYISSLCEKYGLDYEIIQAVNGRELGSDFIQSISDEEISKKRLGRVLSVGEIGCALSHKKVFLRMFELDLKEAVILEDDAYFDEELLRVLRFKERFPKDLELLLLGHYRQVYLDDGFRIETPFSRRFDYYLDEKYSLKRIVGGGFGTHGYYITKKGAKKMYEALQKIIVPYDHCTSNDKITNLYALYPVVVRTDEIFGKQTYIQDGSLKVRYKKRNLISKIIKRIKKEILFLIPSFRRLREYE